MPEGYDEAAGAYSSLRSPAARFTVIAIDANNGIATASTTLAVSSGLALSFPVPPSGQVIVAYGDTLTGTGIDYTM